MKLIDKETIRAEIERQRQFIEELFTEGDNSFYDGQDDAYCYILAFLAFLESIQEQPVEMDNEEKIRNFFDAMGDCGFSQDNILLLKSIWEDAGCQIPQLEQPVEGLEEAARLYADDQIPTDYPDYFCRQDIKDAFIDGAEWGASHAKQVNHE